MKVLHLNTHDTGGAAVAAYRLHDGLKRNGIDSRFLVLYNSGKYNDVITFETKKFSFLSKKIASRIRGTPGHLRGNNSKIEAFTSPDTFYNLLADKHVVDADLIHLHWVADFLDYHSFFRKIGKPLVWTFHDRNPVDGGFHYEIDKIFSSKELLQQNDKFQKLKLMALEGCNIPVITPSTWLRDEVYRSKFSAVFSDVNVIPYGLDPADFYPTGREQARIELGLGRVAGPWLLIIATDLGIYRKGLDLIEPIIEKLKDVNFLVAGKQAAAFANYKNVTQIGVVTNTSMLRTVYNCADAMLLSSREDNLPNVMLEALMCGTPVIAFSVGGIAETIAPGFNGELAATVGTSALEESINSFFRQRERFKRDQISSRAHEKYDILKQAETVTNLYRKVIKESV